MRQSVDTLLLIFLLLAPAIILSLVGKAEEVESTEEVELVEQLTEEDTAMAEVIWTRP